MNETTRTIDAINKWQHDHFNTPKVVIVHPETFFKLQKEWNDNMEKGYVMQPVYTSNGEKEWSIVGCRVISSYMVKENEILIY